ncbi:hypothetical protein O6H91_07G079400 [Diphasiastrum complanatum]|uniref:Uncharacterized protein n=1 Tax=Diphasiastrum complanatum TaxID=34168 RepID=A0ACC2D6X9_DIPCM|nr:hypothetical protein O6H91_07G079400 [Diphasiastrum complanatum]
MAAAVTTVAAGASACLQIGLSHYGVPRFRESWDLLRGSAYASLPRSNEAERLCRLGNNYSAGFSTAVPNPQEEGSLKKCCRARLRWHTMPEHICKVYSEGLRFPIEGDETKVSIATSGPLRTLILDNYDSYTYNLFQLLAVINGELPVVLKNDEISWKDLHSLLYKHRAFHNVVISPGPGSPTCAADIGICMPLLKECPDIPILGVCMGHQALGFAHGAKVLHAPEPVHGRLSEVVHSGHPLFNEIPSGLGSGFKVVRYHSLVLDSTSLPEDLIPTAWTVTPDPLNLESSTYSGQINGKETANDRSFSPGTVGAHVRRHVMASNRQVAGNVLKIKNPGDANIACQQEIEGFSMGDTVKRNGGLFKDRGDELDWSNMLVCREHQRVLMGVSHRTWPHHGVQFHPESVATTYGRKILENFANLTWKHWRNHSWQPKNSAHKEVPLCKGKSLNLKKKESLHDAAQLTDGCQSQNAESSRKLSRNQIHEFSAEEGPVNCFGGTESNSIINMAKNEEHIRSKLRLSHIKLPGFARNVGGSSSLFCELFGTGSAEDTFWLDSSNRDEGRARFSFMGGRGGDIWRRITYSISDDVGVAKVEDAAGQCEEKVLENGFLDYLNDLYSCRKEDCKPLPFEFNGGFVGYLGYELKVECGAQMSCHKSPFPDASFFLADRLVVVDHSNEDVYILALYEDLSPHNQALKGGVGKPADKKAPRERSDDSVQRLQPGLSSKDASIHGDGTSNDIITKGVFATELCSCSSRCMSNIGAESGTEVSRFCSGSDSQASAEAWMVETVEKILGMSQIDENALLCRRLSTCLASSSGIDDPSSTFTSRKTRNEYLKDVGQCLDYIRDGESYEICLTTQLQKKINSQKPLRLYLTLRETNPAPYAAWLQFGAAGPCICCSSPERFLRLDSSGTLEAKPIKGTLPRGSSPQEDEMLRSQLEHSEKDRAENLMIVDLLRNDLGRVCQPGSVHVPSLMKVETYSTVHTMVSTVRGKKKEEVTPVDCVRAAFPGGSMTGAPKMRTLEILDTVESSARGIYSGTIGFFSFNNSFDLNIVIRTVIIYNGEASIGAGGAIVSLSDPEAEYAEMLLKTKASVRAVSLFENETDPSTNQEHKGCPLPF